MKIFTLVVSFFFYSLILLSQQTGKLLIMSYQDCEIVVDGQKSIEITAATPKVIELIVGEHFIQKKCDSGNEIVKIKANEQVILQIGKEELAKPENIENIILTDQVVQIPGSLENTLITLSDQDYEDSGLPIFHYYFQKGDEISINITKVQSKGSFNISLFSYPDSNILVSRNNFEILRDLSYQVKENGILAIYISTNYAFPRSAKLSIERKKSSNHNSSKVVRKVKYEAVSLQEPMKLWVNSTSNETWKGGKSRTHIPVQLPKNTVEWYYIFSASRSEQEVENNKNKLNLYSELAGALTGISGTVLSLGSNIISSPPSTSYCDVYLLDYDNLVKFLNKQNFTALNGSVENINSGKMKMTSPTEGFYYLGFKNNSTFHGIGVAIEVVAITREYYYDTE